VKKQLTIHGPSGKSIVIDLVDDESVQVHLEIHPNKFMPTPAEPTLEVSGLRWRDGKHYHLGWGESRLTTGQSVRIEYSLGELAPTPLVKEDEYISPEKDCMFCQKTESQVEILFTAGSLARICDQCVQECQDVMSERKAKAGPQE
jgi:hypothetical protein